MTSIPPLLPEEVLIRVLRLARMDGLSLLMIATVFALVAATMRDIPFTIVFLLGAGAGAIELHGVALLRQGDARGMNWLIASQPFLFLVVLAYCALRITHFEVPPIPDSLRPTFTTGAAQFGMSVEEYMRTLTLLTAGVVAVVSLIYQGAMTIYYLRRRSAVVRALQVE